MPPVPVRAGPAGAQGPSTFDKWKMGLMMGGTVGLIMGFIFGSVNIIRYGAGPNGALRQLGQYMLGMGTTFGFFMSIGTVIRTEGRSPLMERAYAQAQAKGYPIHIEDARRYGANLRRSDR